MTDPITTNCLIPQGPAELLLEACRADLARRYGINGELVDVRTLSKILGMGQATIYEHLRKGIFFLPHRMLHQTPKVSLDDLARWHCSIDSTASVRRKATWTSPKSQPRPTIDQDVADAVAQSMAALSEQHHQRGARVDRVRR